MTRQQATKAAAVEAARLGLPALCIVQEGMHADEFAGRDTDGESYGYCTPQALHVLYKYGKVVETVNYRKAQKSN